MTCPTRRACRETILQPPWSVLAHVPVAAPIARHVAEPQIHPRSGVLHTPEGPASRLSGVVVFTSTRRSAVIHIRGAELLEDEGYCFGG